MHNPKINKDDYKKDETLNSGAFNRNSYANSNYTTNQIFSEHGNNLQGRVIPPNKILKKYRKRIMFMEPNKNLQTT